MSYDEQPDGDVHGECAFEIKSLERKVIGLQEENSALKKVLEGLPEGAIDGGWTAKGISQHAATLENENAALKAKLTELKVWKELSEEQLDHILIFHNPNSDAIYLMRKTIEAFKELNRE